MRVPVRALPPSLTPPSAADLRLPEGCLSFKQKERPQVESAGGEEVVELELLLCARTCMRVCVCKCVKCLVCISELQSLRDQNDDPGKQLIGFFFSCLHSIAWDRGVGEEEEQGESHGRKKKEKDLLHRKKMPG